MSLCNKESTQQKGKTIDDEEARELKEREEFEQLTREVMQLLTPEQQARVCSPTLWYVQSLNACACR